MVAPARVKDSDFVTPSKRKHLPIVDLLGKKGAFQTLPAAWEDQALYFLLLGRLFDDNENVYRDPKFCV
jgi:hypothetical protein